MDGKYIRFHIINKLTKTKVYGIYTLKDELIGLIKWHPAWRQYCFFPYENTVWSNGCLHDLRNFMYQISKEYKDTKTMAVKPIPPLSKDRGILGVIL